MSFIAIDNRHKKTVSSLNLFIFSRSSWVKDISEMRTYDLIESKDTNSFKVEFFPIVEET